MGFRYHLWGVPGHDEQQEVPGVVGGWFRQQQRLQNPCAEGCDGSAEGWEATVTSASAAGSGHCPFSHGHDPGGGQGEQEDGTWMEQQGIWDLPMGWSVREIGIFP